MGTQERAKETALYATERTINGAAAMYHAEHGGWPAKVSELNNFLDPETVSKYGTLTFADGEVQNIYYID